MPEQNRRTQEAAPSVEATARLRAAAALPDDAIALDDPDAPETTDWSGAVRGRFAPGDGRTLRIDPDVLSYFEGLGPGVESRINRTLRAAMLRDRRRRAVG